MRTRTRSPPLEVLTRRRINSSHQQLSKKNSFTNGFEYLKTEFSTLSQEQQLARRALRTITTMRPERPASGYSYSQRSQQSDQFIDGIVKTYKKAQSQFMQRPKSAIQILKQSNEIMQLMQHQKSTANTADDSLTTIPAPNQPENEFIFDLNHEEGIYYGDLKTFTENRLGERLVSRHGKGTFIFKDGRKYEGDFKRNKRTGFGKQRRGTRRAGASRGRELQSLSHRCV